MKLRNPHLIRLLSRLGAWAIQGLVGSMRYHTLAFGTNPDPWRLTKSNNRYIYAFWHEAMLLPAFHYARPDIHVLISTHADGELISEVIERLGFRSVRGSSTRRGMEALLHMIRLSRHSHIAITPDGPRGPRRQVHMGTIFLASRTGLPIVPIGIAYRRCWRAKSWDRFAVPFPCSHGYCVTLDAIEIPAKLTPDELEPYRKLVEESMLRATEIAEVWAQTGKRPTMAAPVQSPLLRAA